MKTVALILPGGSKTSCISIISDNSLFNYPVKFYCLIFLNLFTLLIRELGLSVILSLPLKQVHFP